ncbi:NADPH-dependent ferric siderophore reductase, contains FAD-binding and SIP domains [Agrococcus baldri]|uniref:NADPH-dependent ferric siderophore reductase, contains FAD-binding and SIP domains n=1 Tax=Agrococcus baldri TaxID=153730 RepID=A0AA94HNQ0_9MICO|nr:siderophore-interacting protein [Agrococcus baldri]SFS16197.1 NADPH-dependent ferric siderophore reductase, contains FAD-binding and SIP domains [Agrococcus baldri]
MSNPLRAPRPPRPQHVLEVLSSERIAPSLVRVRLGGPGLATFTPNAFTDAYVKLMFVGPELGLEPPYDLEALRETLAPGDLPVTRTYTVREVTADSIALDFVVHGAEGLAGPWAATVQPGERVAFSGPGGAFAPDDTADWHLFAGDESALPAIARAIEALGADARGIAVIEVRDASEEIGIAAPAGVEVRWLHRGEPRAATIGLLAEAVAQLDWPEGRVQAFVHGERESMKAMRDELFTRRGLERAQVSLSGYWAQGRTEQRFQAEKREPIGQILPSE